jgi:HEAT repeat protein
MMQRTSITCSALAVVALALTGCQSIWTPNIWPFPERERTTYTTPKMRVDAVAEFGPRSCGVDTPEQREITDQLARQIQIEPDPLVRKAVVHAIAEFRTPMAQQVLEAGLSDQDEMVRVACCQELGDRAVAGLSDPGNQSIAALANALRTDQDMNVRIAATEALGKIKTPEAIQAVAAALEDRDPALQFVGVQSMKSITGKDYGPDVQTWRQVAAGQNVPEPPPPSVAERIQGYSPF